MADINKKFICIGDVICVPFDNITNLPTSLATALNVSIGISYDESVLQYLSHDLTKGGYDPATKKWIVDTLVPGESVAGDFCFTVIDDCTFPTKVTATIEDGECVVSNQNTYCVNIDGLSPCQLDALNYKPINTTVTENYTMNVKDYTVYIDASINDVIVTLPPPHETWSSVKGGREYYIGNIDLTNLASVITLSGKIVDHSTVADASSAYIFTIPGQTIILQSDGTNYHVKTL